MKAAKRHVVVALLMLALVVPAWAADSVGQIVALSGKPKIQRAGGGLIQLAKNDPVYVGDIVKTGDGQVKILFEDNSLMTLAANTELKITEYLFEPQAQKRSSMLDLLQGKVKTLVGSFFSSTQDFRVRTPTAVAGVRGTYFRVDFDVTTDVVVFDGKVDVQAGNGASFTLGGGGYVRVGAGGFNGEPQQLPASTLKQKEKEVEIRMQDAMNRGATQRADAGSLARSDIDRMIAATPGAGGDQTPAAGDLPQNKDGLQDLQSVDPKIQGNANLQLVFPQEK